MNAAAQRSLVIVAVAWGASLGAAQEEQAGLVALVTKRFRAVENSVSALAMDVAIEVSEIDGVMLDPPAVATVRWRIRSGRSLVEVDGVDLDRNARPQTVEREARRARLNLPGGMSESLDLRTGLWSRDQRTYLDAATLPSDAGVGEFLWSFCGTRRSAILEARAAKVSSIRGETPARVVEITADDRADGQRIVFECDEAWGFLPAKCRMLVRDAGRWIEVRTIEVKAARRSRLGWMPESASLVALRPPAGGPGAPATFGRFRAQYRFGPPEFAEVTVPTTVAAAAQDTRPVGADSAIGSPFDQDPIFASSSVLVHEPIAARGTDLDRFLEPVLRGRTSRGPGVGRPREWGSLSVALAAAVVVIGLLGLLLGSRRMLIGGAVASLVGLGGVTAWAFAQSASGARGAYEVIARMGTVQSPVLPRSKSLCGVDCLYAATALVGKGADYARLVRLVRPGTHGSTLEALRIAAECLDLEPHLVNPRSFEEPPDPMIAHVAPRHFIVLTGVEQRLVAIVDPGRGIFRARWEEVRGLLSPAALSFGKRTGS
jgi:hypothetical protein